MSLDVSLYMKATEAIGSQEKIFIRENGSTKEITRNEWDLRFPGREPVVMKIEGIAVGEEVKVFTANITHNLTTMADAAGIYQHLWRPEEIGIEKASELIQPLSDGLVELLDNPEKYKQYNPSNGWGTYGGLVAFVKRYLEACATYPEATIWVSR